jgi:uncharacterized protein YegL
MENKEEHILILIDTSYSMIDDISKVINSLNIFLRNLNNNFYVTIATFNDKLKYIVTFKKINLLKNFDVHTFKPDGFTSLYDSISNVILNFGLELEIKTHFFIVSDGGNNITQQYTKEQTDELCKMATSSGKWNITYCNTNTDLLNIPTIQYDIDNIANIFDNLNLSK